MSKKIAGSNYLITLDTVVYHDPEMVTAPMDDELVMFSLKQGMYYGLDSIASFIWQRIQLPISVAELCASLQEEYAVDTETCQHDTLELLNWLYDQELIKIDTPSG